MPDWLSDVKPVGERGRAIPPAPYWKGISYPPSSVDFVGLLGIAWENVRETEREPWATVAEPKGARGVSARSFNPMGGGKFFPETFR